MSTTLPKKSVRKQLKNVQTIGNQATTSLMNVLMKMEATLDELRKDVFKIKKATDSSKLTAKGGFFQNLVNLWFRNF